MSIIIPTLRAENSGTLTVPTGKAYSVKSGNIQTVTINGTTYQNRLLSTDLVSGAGFPLLIDRIGCGECPILNSGDSATANDIIYYWDVGEDFKNVNLIPTYYTTTASIAFGGTTSQTITVPTNETWVINIIEFVASIIINNGTTTTVNIDLDANISGQNTTFFRWGATNTFAATYSQNRRVNSCKVILKGDDTLTLNYSILSGAIASSSATINILYNKITDIVK